MDKCNYWLGQERENPFKARNANQGPWLIHLSNLWVMYECRGTLVKESVCMGLRVCVFVSTRGIVDVSLELSPCD